MTNDLTGITLKNNYFLRELVGSGGMADVYKAWDKEKHTLMAVKVLRRDLAPNPGVFQMFAREAKLLRDLEHPNIVRLYEFNKENDLVYIVLDWVDGRDLRQRIISGGAPLTLDECSEVLNPVCNALGFAHNRKTFHCDVKPANIMLHNNGFVKITDFGIAHTARETGIGGTPPYMAPEQFLGQPVDGRTDVYALGITLFEMLSGGTVPFRGDTPQSLGSSTQERIAWEHLNLQLPELNSFNPAVPQSVFDVIRTAASKDQSKRYASVASFMEAFEQSRMMKNRSKPTSNTIFSGEIAPVQNLVKPRTNPPPERVNIKGPFLFCQSGDFTGQAIRIPPAGLKIGRSSTCQLKLSEINISRNHASIISANRGIYLQDENSQMGTLLNGRRISNISLLKDGDVIQIGYNQVFTFRKG